jgi:ribosomal-protein-alanine N-acetyltransferase
MHTVGRVEPRDIPQIKKIEDECGLSPWTVEAYVTEQLHPDSVMLKAYLDDGTIVGFLAGRSPAGGEAEILNIGTALAFQRKGIGSALIGEFRSICTERQVSAIWLEVRSSNIKAIDFYKSHGFVTKGRRPNFYSNPTEDADLMELTEI